MRMKRLYERPVMMAEVFETNAYCGMCSANPQVKYFETIPAQCYSNDRQGDWAPNRYYRGNKLSHKFPAKDPMITTGKCGRGPEHDIKDQYVWKCDGTCGETWFLEWSHYYSVHENHGTADVFFLYKDANNDGKIQIIDQGGSYPKQETGTDINVAMVEYGKVMVANS